MSLLSADAAVPASIRSFKLMTVNTHKGFTALNRRFILGELRDAVRTVGADVVCLQEVHGAHARHAQLRNDWPATPHYEFLADSMWPQFAYGRNAVYPEGDHGNAVLSKFPIARHVNHDVSVAGNGRREAEKRGLLHCALRLPGRDVDVHYDPADPGHAALENPAGMAFIVLVMALAMFAIAVWKTGIFDG